MPSECVFLQNCLIGSIVHYILKLISHLFGIMPLIIKMFLDWDAASWEIFLKHTVLS